MSNRYLGNRKRSRRSNAPMEAQVLYKQSNLSWRNTIGEIRLIPVCFPNKMRAGVSVNADAECSYKDEKYVMHIGKKEIDFTGLNNKIHGEESPSKLCTCGFHAYREYIDARTHVQEASRGYFVLKVVASGRMFEYNKGYRYGHQRVEEVIVSTCRSMSQ